jgi:hypothetical protein
MNSTIGSPSDTQFSFITAICSLNTGDAAALITREDVRRFSDIPRRVFEDLNSDPMRAYHREIESQITDVKSWVQVDVRSAIVFFKVAEAS